MDFGVINLLYTGDYKSQLTEHFEVKFLLSFFFEDIFMAVLSPLGASLMCIDECKLIR